MEWVNESSWCMTKTDKDGNMNLDTNERWGDCDYERCQGD